MSSPAASALAPQLGNLRRLRLPSGARGRLSCGVRFGTSHAGSLGCCQRSIVPSSWTIVRNGTPDLYSDHIAAFAERHTHHCAPARNSASRVARCDRLHCPRRDFSSIVIDCPRYQTVRPAPQACSALLAHRAAGHRWRYRVGRGPERAGRIKPRVEQPSELHMLPPFLAACHSKGWLVPARRRRRWTLRFPKRGVGPGLG